MEERRKVSEIRMKNDENHAKIWVRSMQNFYEIEEFVNQSLMVEAMPIKWLIYQLKC
jgi:ribosome-binding factor A